MKVADILKRSARRPFTINSSETIGHLAQQFRRHRIDIMVVSDDGQTIDGIISERDIAYALAERRGELRLLPVSALMVRQVITCSSGDSMSYVMSLMKLHQIRHIPVKDSARLSGMISMRDAIEFRLAAIERKINFAKCWQLVE